MGFLLFLKHTAPVQSGRQGLAGDQTTPRVWRKDRAANTAPTTTPPTASRTTCCRVAIVDQMITEHWSALSHWKVYGTWIWPNNRLSQKAENTAGATCSEGKALLDASRPLMIANAGYAFKSMGNG